MCLPLVRLATFAGLQGACIEEDKAAEGQQPQEEDDGRRERAVPLAPALATLGAEVAGR